MDFCFQRPDSDFSILDFLSRGCPERFDSRNAGGPHLGRLKDIKEALEEDTPPPIPYREILLTARIMEIIFSQLTTLSPADQEGLSLQTTH